MADAITPRVHSVQNMVNRAIAASSGSSPTPACPSCHAVMWYSIFFDGTGNNAKEDFPSKHSNIVALRDAHIDDPKRSIFRSYYEGLGTSFEFLNHVEEVPLLDEYSQQVGSYERVGYKEEKKFYLGLGLAKGINERLEKALFDFIKQIHDQRMLYRIDEIRLAVFGFSRGATEARAFLNWLSKVDLMTLNGKVLTYDGTPVTVKFLGIFDTVESVGTPGGNKSPDLIKTVIPSFVEKCTHIVAAHEYRHAFSLTIGDGSARHVVYPGSHSDVGGGFDINDQGRNAQLARVALLQMLDEARGAGLKMMSIDEMRVSNRWDDLLKPSFGMCEEANKALQGYLAVVKPSGTVTQHMQAHKAAHISWIDSGRAIEDVRKKLAPLASNAKARKDLACMDLLLSSLGRSPQARGAGTPLQGPPSPAVVVNQVVAFLLACQATLRSVVESLFLGALGLRCTSVMGLQSRHAPVQRFGCFSRAAA